MTAGSVYVVFLGAEMILLYKNIAIFFAWFASLFRDNKKLSDRKSCALLRSLSPFSHFSRFPLIDTISKN
jgi:hypothetical protein